MTKVFRRCWFMVWINFSLDVTKGFSGFLVKTVESARGWLRLSDLSHGKFYFYYPLKLRKAGALVILTGSLPPVCYMLHWFLGSLGIWWGGCHPVNPYSVYFSHWFTLDLIINTDCCVIYLWYHVFVQENLLKKPLGHQYCRQQLYSKRINRLFSIAGGNSSGSLWLTQAFEPFPREVLLLLSPNTHQSLTQLTLKRAYSNAEILNSYLYSATPVFREWQKRDSS